MPGSGAHARSSDCFAAAMKPSKALFSMLTYHAFGLIGTALSKRLVFYSQAL
jgi:hypothetical protein